MNFGLSFREVNSDNLTPAPTSEERSHWDGQYTRESSSTSSRSNSESRTGTEEVIPLFFMSRTTFFFPLKMYVIHVRFQLFFFKLNCYGHPNF
jgi:hypothetical protein